jgi:rare lipoprotein A
MKAVMLCGLLLAATTTGAWQNETPSRGLASWYGEPLRGRFMANGRQFDPDKLTAASWYYPLGTRVRVSLRTRGLPSRTVVVTITDRGPAPELVREGRIIDLSRAAFRRIGRLETGLLPVRVEAVETIPAGPLLLSASRI